MVNPLENAARHTPARPGRVLLERVEAASNSQVGRTHTHRGRAADVSDLWCPAGGERGSCPESNMCAGRTILFTTAPYRGVLFRKLEKSPSGRAYTLRPPGPVPLSSHESPFEHIFT